MTAKHRTRLEYAVRQLKKHNIEHEIKSASGGHIHVRQKSNDVLHQLWTGTGTICDSKGVGRKDVRGLHRLVKICDDL